MVHKVLTSTLATLFTPLLLAVAALVFRTIPARFDPAAGEDREFAEFLRPVEYFRPGKHRAQPTPGHVSELGDSEVTGPHATVRLPISAAFAS